MSWVLTFLEANSWVGLTPPEVSCKGRTPDLLGEPYAWWVFPGAAVLLAVCKWWSFRSPFLMIPVFSCDRPGLPDLHVCILAQRQWLGSYVIPRGPEFLCQQPSSQHRGLGHLHKRALGASPSGLIPVTHWSAPLNTSTVTAQEENATVHKEVVACSRVLSGPTAVCSNYSVVIGLLFIIF